MLVNSNGLRSNSELRAMARERLKGNWGRLILACFLASILMAAGSIIPIAGVIICIILAGPFTLGLYGFLLKFKREENPPIETIFDGFKNFTPSLLLYILMSVFTFLWALLLIVPGIIAALSYSQAFFIMHDNPGMGAMEALKLSKDMMKGQKGKLFMLYLSFIGWAILCMLTLGIGYLWLAPYMYLSFANFYDDVKANSISNQTF